MDLKSKNPGAGDQKEAETFYTRVYDDAVAKKTPVDNAIIEQTCEVGGGRVESLGRVFDSGGEGDPAASHHAAYTASLATIHKQRRKAQHRYATLVANILTHEPDLRAQEERRREGALIQERQKLESDILEERIQYLQERIFSTRKDTAATNEKVTTYLTYKEYVENSVQTFGNEAATVEGVCGRFRDLLTLRLQLLLKVNHARLQLQQSRRQLLMFVQSEKEREGQALLELYRARSAGWASSRRLGEMEARLAALQAASTHTHTHLTRVRLALANIYSVARSYQRSLPPLGSKAPSSAVLERLHNFLLDAITVTTAARNATQPDSMRPSAPSLNKFAMKEASLAKPPVTKRDASKDKRDKSEEDKKDESKSQNKKESKKGSAVKKRTEGEVAKSAQSETRETPRKEMSINKPQLLKKKNVEDDAK
ncbi:uncharacterized protein [Macrobrachium rosenbergii]|uniref:uncharacterized protein n=1 Tax=Macrobrachium rosenbergii TaxID=79674 RepID=UPI0034D5023E